MLSSTDIALSGRADPTMLCRLLVRHGSLTVRAGLAQLPIRVSGSLHKSSSFCVCGTAPNAFKQSKAKPRPPVKRRPMLETPDVDEFFAPAEASFTALGISPAVADALQRAGFSRPSAVQVLKGRRLTLWFVFCCGHVV